MRCRLGRRQSIRPPGLVTRRSILRRAIPRRSRLHRLDRRPAPVGRRTIPRLIDRPVIPGPCSRAGINRVANRCRWPVIRWPVAPIAAIPWTVVIRHGARSIPGIRRTIPAMPTAPRTAVVINPPRSPIPSPAAPSPGLADQQRGNPDANPERDQPRVQAAPRIHHGGVILRHVHHLRIHRLDHVDGLTAVLLHLDLLLRSAAQGARCVGLRPQPLDRRRHLILIRRNRGPDGRIVINVLRHHRDHIRKPGQSYKRRIETLLLGSSGQLRECLVIGSAPANY